MKVLCFIPVFNEETNLQELINDINLNNYEIDEFLFVNSGSTDNSLEIIKQSKYKHISINENKGLGYLFIKAIDYGIQNKFDIFVVLSGNNKMNPADFKKVLDPIIYKNYDFVSGSRYLEDGLAINTPRFRNTSIPILSKVITLLYGKKITDATNGFRAFKLDKILNLLPKYDQKWLYGYSFETYLFGLVLNSKEIKSIEVPVEIRYKKDIKHTKIKPFLDYPSIVMPFLIAKFK
tara:strand:- start:1085 stop:1789 length:705 start_codon:yes stop_codon:yes gene_type:complete